MGGVGGGDDGGLISGGHISGNKKKCLISQWAAKKQVDDAISRYVFHVLVFKVSVNILGIKTNFKCWEQ